MPFRRSSKPPQPKWLEDDDDDDDDDDDAAAPAAKGKRDDEPPQRRQKARERGLIARFFVGLFSLVFLLFRIGILSVLVFCFAAGTSFYVVRHRITGSEEPAPNLLGMSIPDALRSLSRGEGSTSSSLSLKLDINGEEYSNEVKEGEITYQFPFANSMVKAGSAIRVRISKGNSKVKCPNLEDMNYQNAVIELHKAGLKEGARSTEANAKVKRDCVVSQEPPAGAELERQTAVNLLVSLGPPKATVQMPDLTSSTVPEAQALLQTLGLQAPQVSETTQIDTDNGVIIRQSPAAKSIVGTEDPISVTVVNNLGVESETPQPEPTAAEESVPSLPGQQPSREPVRPATPPDTTAAPVSGQ